MGKIKLKTNLQRIAFADENKYITSAMRYSTISAEQLIEYACENSGIPKAQMASSFYAIQQQIEQFVLNGHSLELGNLGTFYLSTRCKAVDTKEAAGAEAVEGLYLRFRQSKRIRTLLETNIDLTVVTVVPGESGEENDEQTGGTGTGTGNEDEEGNVMFAGSVFGLKLYVDHRLPK